MKDNFITRTIGRFASKDDIEERSVSIAPTTAFGLPYGFSMPTTSNMTSMQLSAVYRCVEVISDAIASQTWQVLEYNKADGWAPNEFSDAYYLLNNEPNMAMSRFTLMKTLVAKMLLEGNGYIQIHRNAVGDPVRLELINDTVKIYRRSDDSLYYEVGKPGAEYIVDGQDMIHVLNFTYDGYTGVSTLRHAANSVGLSYASESTAKGFFLSGANNSGILTVKGKMTKEKASDIKQGFREAFNITTGEPGGIVVMEEGLTFEPISVNPRDAQMLETRQFNVIEICRFFGVSPSKVFDNNNLTYSNIEAFQLGFLTDTISPLDAKIEAEFNRKLLRPSKRLNTKLNLNINELLRANMDSKANYYSKLFQVGAYTPNEIRTEIGQPKVKGGDKSYVQINLMPVDQVITQKTNTKTQTNETSKETPTNTIS